MTPGWHLILGGESSFSIGFLTWSSPAYIPKMKFLSATLRPVEWSQHIIANLGGRDPWVTLNFRSRAFIFNRLPVKVITCLHTKNEVPRYKIETCRVITRYPGLTHWLTDWLTNINWYMPNLKIGNIYEVMICTGLVSLTVARAQSRSTSFLCIDAK